MAEKTVAATSGKQTVQRAERTRAIKSDTFNRPWISMKHPKAWYCSPICRASHRVT